MSYRTLLRVKRNSPESTHVLSCNLHAHGTRCTSKVCGQWGLCRATTRLWPVVQHLHLLLSGDVVSWVRLCNCCNCVEPLLQAKVFLQEAFRFFLLLAPVLPCAFMSMPVNVCGWQLINL